MLAHSHGHPRSSSSFRFGKFKGPGILAYPQIASWLNEMGPELWEEIGSHDTYVPIGPWKENGTF